MDKVHKIKIEPMTAESFAPFGDIIDATERPPERRINAPLDYYADGNTTVSAIWQPEQGLKFWQMERHFGVTQSFIQLGGSPAAVAVAAPTPTEDGPDDIPSLDQIRAFLIDPTKGFAFKVGTWHSMQRFILSPPGATFIVINSDPNPSQTVNFKENYSLSYTDLATDKEPKRLDLGSRYGVVLEMIP